jgi:hypothetical protein
MATLGSLIQPNEQSYFFALAGPGPGPSSSLQSPVAIIPDGAGNTTIAVTASAPTGASAVSVVGSAPGVGVGEVGGPGNVIVGGFGVNYRVGVQDASSILNIGLNSSAAPVIQYDSQVSHQLLLGDKSGLSTASVQTNVPFVVRDYTTDPTVLNGILMAVNTPTLATVSAAAASQATLRIGSSTAYQSTLTVSDVPKNGAAAYVEINGTAGAVPLFIAAAQGPGGASYVYPDGSGATASLNLGSSTTRQDTLTIIEPVAGTSIVKINGSGGGNAAQIAGGTTPSVSTDFGSNGALQLRSSAAGYAGDGAQNGVVFTDNSVSGARPLANFKSQIVLPSSASGQWCGIAGQQSVGINVITGPGQAAGTFADTQGAVLPLPPSGAQYSGLWMYRILTKNTNDSQAIQACMTTTAYWDGALNAFTYPDAGSDQYFGGAVGVTTSNGNARIIPNLSGLYITTFSFANFTGSTITGMGCQIVQLTGIY